MRHIIESGPKRDLVTLLLWPTATGGSGFDGYEVVDLDPRVPVPRGLLRTGLLDLPPLFLGPSELLDRRSEVEEVDRHDRSAGSQIGIADQRIQLATSLYQAVVDQLEPLGLLGAITVPVRCQGRAPLRGIAAVPGYNSPHPGTSARDILFPPNVETFGVRAQSLAVTFGVRARFFFAVEAALVSGHARRIDRPTGARGGCGQKQ
jgi:hypothetical protein